MKTKAAIPLAFFAMVSWGGGAAAQSRAEFNLQRLLNGQVQWSMLTPQERQEIMDLDRLLRSIPADKSTDSERCWRNELEKNGSSPLARELIELRCGGSEKESEPQKKEGSGTTSIGR